MADYLNHDGDQGEQSIKFTDLDSTKQELINAAIQARKAAYCPYSGFAVGAALRTVTGEIFTGCNIEASSFTPSICAERVAIGNAVSKGYQEFSEIAVVAYQEQSYTAPCGVCRQFMSEFAKKDYTVYLAKPAPFTVLVTSVYKLLPLRFTTYKSN